MNIRKLLPLLLILTGISSAQPDFSHEMKEVIKKNNLMKKNGISEQRVFFTDTDNNFIPTGLKINESIENYDTEGRIINRAVNYSYTDTSYIIQYSFFYNDTDHLVDMMISGSEKDTIYFSYQKDTAGNVTEYLSYIKDHVGADSITGRFKCIYDGQNRLLVTRSGDQEVMRYNYDASGNLSYIESGSIITRYEYDEKGQILTKVVSSSENSEAKEISKYTYDSNGNIKTLKIEGWNGSLAENRYVYDDRGLQLKAYFASKIKDSDGTETEQFVIVENEYK
ncbi:MAG: hypothetical protein HUU43_13240 [Ignavibacteriaceae bacterium]|nr:YD repeat-containing protein [Ignavibacteriaceae bacterium]NUM71807.1 hypothetical protein [Ignavibacteriaceae bacterium]